MLRVFILLLLSFPAYSEAQVICPPNIGFEQNSFQNWELFIGGAGSTGPGLDFAIFTPPVNNVHTINSSANTALDPYGLFPVHCPDGAGYSMRLGNKLVGAEAEMASYSFTVPINQPNYTLVFYYAVVLQNPQHQEHEQPKFKVNIFDVAANDYIDCATFKFIASDNLQGFENSLLDPTVYFKNWAPISLNMSGLEGKTIRLEFITEDCTLGGHFGYAYIDVDEGCLSPVKGSVICPAMDSLTLVAPPGFWSYRWYDVNFTQLLSTVNTLPLKPLPPVGTVYATIVHPFPGQGCMDTFYTTITQSTLAFDLVVQDSLFACMPTGVNLSAPTVFAGSTPGLTIKYYHDPIGTQHISIPSKIINSGTYYIGATNAGGCRLIKPVKVRVDKVPDAFFMPFINSCSGNPVNLTDPVHIFQADPGLTYSYWLDSAGTQPVPNPTNIVPPGTFYIRASSEVGCKSNMYTMPVTGAVFNTNDVTGCKSVSITGMAVTAGSTAGFSFSYWQDPAATIPLSNPYAITSTGVYYIKASSVSGCTIIKPVNAAVEQEPDFSTSGTIVVDYPATVNLFQGLTPGSGPATFTYWKDSAATQPVSNYSSINQNGSFFIKAVSPGGCQTVKRLNVIINPAPPVTIEAPNAFSPNGDGINDLFEVTIKKGIIRFGGVTVYNRWGNIVFETRHVNRPWNGLYRGNPVPFGTYYWVFEGEDLYYKKKVIEQGSITLIK